MKAQHTRPRTTRGNVISVSSDGPNDSPYEEFSLETPPPRQDAPTPPSTSGGSGNGGGSPVTCPSCGAVNPANNRHCQECGARLRQGPLPTAPRPAVQATAGVRAALAISGLLLAVILIALFFNIFNDPGQEAVASTSTTSTTIQPPEDPAPFEVLTATCNPEGLAGYTCINLTSGTFGQGNEYQVSWEENRDQGISITLDFIEPMAITGIEWINIEEETRFLQNYRAQSLTIQAQDSLVEFPVRLEDQRGTQQIRYTALNTTRLVIKVVEAYQAEIAGDPGNVFEEIAIDEIVVIGRPATVTTNTTVPGGSTTVPDSSSTTSGG